MYKENINSVDLESLHKNTINRYFENFEPVASYKLPGSLILLGDHTHYNEGISIAGLVDRNVLVSVSFTEDKKSRMVIESEAVEIEVDLIDPLENMRAEVIRQAYLHLKENGVITREFNAVINYDVPECFGLGLYSALNFAFVKVVYAAFGQETEKNELLKLVKKIEMASVGKISNRTHHYNFYNLFKNSLLKIDLRTNEAEPIKFTPSEFRVVIINTGRVISDIRQTCNSRIEDCEVGVNGLKLYVWGIKSLRDVNKTFLERHINMIPRRVYNRVLYNVTERERVETFLQAVENEQYEQFPEIFQQSHDGLKNDYELNYAELNFLQNCAMNIKGICGSKLISCSPIKSTFNIVKAEEVDNFCKEMEKHYLERYGKALNIMVLKLYS